jgi:hypothetical protein
MATEKYAIHEKQFNCDLCNKQYKQRSGLWRHKKKCKKTINLINKPTDTESLKLVMQTIISNLNSDNKIKNELLQQLKAQSSIIQDIIPRIGTTNNNKFNINVFLNEKCKDAINMTEFIDSIDFQMKDIDYTNNNGVMDSISSLFINNLKQMDRDKRPIHCTDFKRETLYIKDNNNWEKDMYKSKMKEIITSLTKKQKESLTEWKVNNPFWEKDDIKKDEYISFVKTLMIDIDKNNIIKHIAKETFINNYQSS